MVQAVRRVVDAPGQTGVLPMVPTGCHADAACTDDGTQRLISLPRS